MKENLADISFRDSQVEVVISPQIAATPGGQLALSLLINLLARMKSIVQSVTLDLPYGIELLPSTPLAGEDLREGLENLVSDLSGPGRLYSVDVRFDGKALGNTVAVAIGREGLISEPDVLIEANAWTAYVNHSDASTDWTSANPIGALTVATVAAAEVFKHVLYHNYPDQGNRNLQYLSEIAFSPLTYGDPPDAILPSLPTELSLNNVAIAGVGAGGSAVVYALSCWPQLTGDISLIDPGRHKLSNLGRYLLSTYQDVAEETIKVDRAAAFLAGRHPNLQIHRVFGDYESLSEKRFELAITTTDTPESRWKIQQDWPPVILDAGVIGTMYSVGRVVPDQGFCLGCKHPYDPDLTYKRIAQAWGMTLGEFNQRRFKNEAVTVNDIVTLASVQNRSAEEFRDLVGVEFTRVPSISDCGNNRFNLKRPNQVASLPFVTTMAGLMIAAEVVKHVCAPEWALDNWFEHDMFWAPESSKYRRRNRFLGCHICGNQG